MVVIIPKLLEKNNLKSSPITGSPLRDRTNVLRNGHATVLWNTLGNMDASDGVVAAWPSYLSRNSETLVPLKRGIPTAKAEGIAATRLAVRASGIRG